MGNTMNTKDDEILFFLNECPMLTRDQLARLTGRTSSYLNDSLNRLIKHKELYRNERKNNWSPYVYAAYDIRKREQFAHDLALSEIYTSLKCTGRVIEWVQPRQKFREDVNEDIMFWWSIQKSEKGDKIKYYLEYETGKNAWWQIDKKFELYNEMRKTELFHVLFVLRNEKCKKLLQYIHRVDEKRYLDADPAKKGTWKRYLFTMFDQITGTPLDSIFRTAFESEKIKYPLSPDLLI